jgi:hypothetical protein
VLRPRTIARTIKSVEDLIAASRDARSRLKRLEQHEELGDARAAEQALQIRALQDAVDDLQVRESRLRAIYRRDIEQQEALNAVERILDSAVIAAHVKRSVEASQLHLEPFPHVVLENLLPQPVYDAVLSGIPPVELFDGAYNKQRIVVPFDMAPAFSRRVWGYLLTTVVNGMLGPAMIDKVRAPLGEWLDTVWPGLAAELGSPQLRMVSTDGRILLRRRGYVIAPHRDPKWGFVTCLMYLARPGDSPEWGTELYEVEDDREASSVAPHWIPAHQCRLSKRVPFHPNTALVFVNAYGAHGAAIPDDAEPPDLERYIYQFRMGPSGDSIRQLVARLPPDRREPWLGKAAEYV